MAALSGIGSLVSGFQQGVGFAQDVKYNRKRQKALDYTLSQMGREDAAAQANSQDISDEERAFYGDQTANAFMPEVGSDPYLYRLMDWAQKRRSRRRTALPATPTEMVPPAPQDEEMPAATSFAYPEYADGGEVDNEAEKIRQRAAQNRARNPGRIERASESVEGADRTRKAAQAAEKAPRKAPGLLRSAAGGAAALAGIGGAIKGYQTPTEDYYTRLGMDPREAGLSFWKDIGVRTAGVLSDVGDTALGMVGINQRKNFADVQQNAEPVAPVPRQALPLASGPNAGQMRASVAARGPAPAAPAVAAQPQPPQAGDAIDMSQLDVDASELPDLKTSDWKRYRAQALRTARLRGLPQAQALDEADKLVTGMQIRGFSNYASQAAALMQVGNMKGAVRALRAAYQYFPDGNDVRLGIQNGHIVGVGIDEETGKPFEGGTRVITPEFLAGAIQNFANPQNFLAWTKDWRDEAFKERKYKEVEKPTAQSEAIYRDRAGRAALANSEAANLRASLTGARGGLKPSDFARSEQVYRQRLELLGVTDAAQADQLAAVMSQIKQANPAVPDNMIVDFVMKAQGRPDGMQFIQRALNGE